jgi:hypothetical protein
MYDDTVRMIKKQKQLIKMEIESYKLLISQGKRGIHPDDYYLKIGKAWLHLDKAQKYLSTVENDIFNNFEYIEN